MKSCVGSRCCQTINFEEYCNDTCLDSSRSLHMNTDGIVLRQDFVTYCCKFIAYKFGVVNPPSGLILKWSKDEWMYNMKVYRDSLEQDKKTSWNILKDLNNNFERSIQDSRK